jgi:Zn-dependent M32 family carboxypeptidase
MINIYQMDKETFDFSILEGSLKTLIEENKLISDSIENIHTEIDQIREDMQEFSDKKDIQNMFSNLETQFEDINKDYNMLKAITDKYIKDES